MNTFEDTQEPMTDHCSVFLPDEREEPLHALRLLVANRPGVVVRLAISLARCAYSIRYLAMTPVLTGHTHTVDLVCAGKTEKLERTLKLLAKLVDVLEVKTAQETQQKLQTEALSAR